MLPLSACINAPKTSVWRTICSSVVRTQLQCQGGRGPSTSDELFQALVLANFNHPLKNAQEVDSDTVRHNSERLRLPILNGLIFYFTSVHDCCQYLVIYRLWPGLSILVTPLERFFCSPVMYMVCPLWDAP